MNAKTDDLWPDVTRWKNPAAELLNDFRRRTETLEPPEATGLDEKDYLAPIAGIVDFFRRQQDERGAIIDPYLDVEYQYSTPCYALAAAVLVECAGRENLIDSALRAMDWAVHCLSARQAASQHEDFYPPVLAHALPLLEKRTDPRRGERWRSELASFDPWKTYRGSRNWNVVALCGEALLHRIGIRKDTSFIDRNLCLQGRMFRSPWGLYVEGPMAYDHFPRMWAADMLAAGYRGPCTERLDEMLDRAAVTSLFIQSPAGELPCGGRSAHHQWNEAQQAVTYEIYAARAARADDLCLAGTYKRAARLALRSVQRWQRPSGELWIVKNRIDPAQCHGFAGYSSHSQYNLLAAAMLAIAFEHSLETRHVVERLAPAETGGFVVDLTPEFPHVFANAGGTYLQINTQADLNYNVTGLTRIHATGLCPRIGPSDGPIESPLYRVPDGPRKAIGVGPAWPAADGGWDSLARYGGESVREVKVETAASPEEVRLSVAYKGNFGRIEALVERYTVRPGLVEIAGELPGCDGPIRYTWPVLADDGERQPAIEIDGDRVTVSLAGTRQVFQAPGATRVFVEETRYPFPNGWAREAVAEFRNGVPPRLTISPKPRE